jgi:hypothetical protein
MKGMKGLVLLACIALALTTAARADDSWGWGWPHLRLPQIVVTPHPAPNAPDYSTCLMKCAGRNDACVRGARGRTGLKRCRLRQSLCDSDCGRYGISER